MRFFKNISHVLGFIVVIVAVFFIISGLPTRIETKAVQQETSSSTATTTREAAILARRAEHFGGIELGAKAVYVFDVRDNQDLFFIEYEKPLPIASITKLMTALVALEHAPSQSTRITIDDEALNQNGDNGFFFQEEWELGALLDVMLVGSSNDSAQAIAAGIGPFIVLETTGSSNEDAFLSAMNDYAKRLGMEQTTFLTPTGLDINGETEASAFGSAKDVTRLFEFILKHHPEALEATQEPYITRSSITHGAHYVENTNALVNEIPLLIGAKTGFTNHAGGNLVLAFDVGPAHPVIITVLGSSKEGRFEDMKLLVEATKGYFGYDN